MYIAMNRFQVMPDRTENFESMWKNRDRHLSEVPGFISFQLLKGPEHEDHILYSSHTLWDDYASFEGWTKSEAFRKAHANAGNSSEPVTIGKPQFEGFEVVLNEDNENREVA